MTPVVYVSGTGRSGTNILKEILGSHSQVASLPFEHRFTVDPHGLVDYYRNVENWSPYIADCKLKELGDFLRSLASRDTQIFDESQLLKSQGKTGHPYAGWELEQWMPGYSQYVDDLMNTLTLFSYEASYPASEAGQALPKMKYYGPDMESARQALSTFLDKCHRAVVDQQSKSIFLEDNTWSILFADVLSQLTPHGKLVHMVRDPRDVIASMLKQRWTPSNLTQVIRYYGDIMYRWQKVKKRLSSRFYMEVKFDELIHHTEDTITNISEFIGINAEPAMFEVDLSKANIGRYKEQFTSEETKQIETALAAYLHQYQYI